MRTSCAISLIATLAVLACQPAAAQQEGPPRAESLPRAAAGSDEAYKKLRAQCERNSCAPSGGESCVEAAAMLLSDTPPDEFWQVDQGQRLKIAVRLLEKGTNSSNLARARAYDIYSSFSLIGGFSDSYRANELMEMMTASGYPGAALRKARSAVAMFSMSATPEQKVAGCNLAKNLLARGGLDSDSQRLAKEILEAGACTPSEPGKN